MRGLAGNVGRDAWSVGVTAEQRAAGCRAWRNDAVQRMVKNRAIARNVLTCANPAVLLDIDLDECIVVIEDAGCRNFLWRYLNNVVGLTKRPLRRWPRELG